MDSQRTECMILVQLVGYECVSSRRMQCPNKRRSRNLILVQGMKSNFFRGSARRRHKGVCLTKKNPAVIFVTKDWFPTGYYFARVGRKAYLTTACT